MWHFRSCGRFTLHRTFHCVSALLWLISLLSLFASLFLSQRKLYQTLMPVWALTCSSYARVLEQRREREKIEAQKKEAEDMRILNLRRSESFKVRVETDLMWRAGTGIREATVLPSSRWLRALSLHLGTRWSQRRVWLQTPGTSGCEGCELSVWPPVPPPLRDPKVALKPEKNVFT